MLVYVAGWVVQGVETLPVSLFEARQECGGVVHPEQAIMHLSWVRSESAMLAKTSTWGHAGERDWSADVLQWSRRGRRPLRTVAAGQLSRNPDNWLRFLRLADTPDAAARARNGLTS